MVPAALGGAERRHGARGNGGGMVLGGAATSAPSGGGLAAAGWAAALVGPGDVPGEVTAPPRAQHRRRTQARPRVPSPGRLAAWRQDAAPHEATSRW